MAIDFLIYGLLLISFTINLLPLGAFWVTPSLRTTASRFVINLLIINLIGCCILGPTLFLSGTMLSSLKETPEGADKNQTIPTVRVMSKRSEAPLQCNLTHCEDTNEKIVITEVNENYLNKIIAADRGVLIKTKSGEYKSTTIMRCWSIDLAAALGALSVLLVVGDTWMAVRDPLRYHSRISGVKSWILIAMTWVFGILFGLMSALREINFQCSALAEKKFYIFLGHIEYTTVTTRTIFSMVFACIYFIVIILLPFGFVCGMYWRIVSEAKENGVRMRQNGSSPLLQSATNINGHRNSLTNTPTHHGGLLMQIDRKRNRKDSSVKIAEGKKLATQSTLPTLSEPEECSVEEKNSTETERPLSSQSDVEIKRHYTGRQFVRQSSQELGECSTNRVNTFRQIQSSPNLQKYNQVRRGSLNGFETTSHHCRNPQNSINTSPKTLSYMSSIRRRLSNASSLFKQREESRAARISILVVIMFLVSYLPYGLLVLFQGPVIENFPYSTQLAVFMILLANLTSPIIFAYRNKQVRHGVTRLFGLDARSKEHRLQRNGIFLRYGTKARISVRRSSSKVSAYSINSCKYLTPILKHTNRSFRSKTNDENKLKRTNTFPTNAPETSCSQKSTPHTIRKSESIDVVDTTVNIPMDEFQHKFSIFKIFCKSSKTTDCATTSTQDCKSEPMEV